MKEKVMKRACQVANFTADKALWRRNLIKIGNNLINEGLLILGNYIWIDT